MKTLPSGSILRPAQNRFAARNGLTVTVSVAGSKTAAPVASVWSPPARPLPSGMSDIWTATRGQSRTCDHWPTTAGSVDVLLVPVTAPAVDTVELPAPSRARAVSVCGPFDAVTVFHGIANGAGSEERRVGEKGRSRGW